MAFDWEGRNVLVIGAVELPGSLLVKELSDRKANVVCIAKKDAKFSGLQWSIKDITLIYGNIEDYFVVERCINEYEIDTVFHFGCTIQGDAIKSPIPIFESNIKGTWNLLEACRHHKHVKGIIMVSGNEAYSGNHKKTENDSVEGGNIYVASKTCSNILAKSYFKTYNIPAVIANLGDDATGLIAKDAMKALIILAEEIQKSQVNGEEFYFSAKHKNFLSK